MTKSLGSKVVDRCLIEADRLVFVIRVVLNDRIPKNDYKGFDKDSNTMKYII